MVGDFLDKPHAEGGLAMSRETGTTVLLALIVALILIFPAKTRAARALSWLRSGYRLLMRHVRLISQPLTTAPRQTSRHH